MVLEGFRPSDLAGSGRPARRAAFTASIDLDERVGALDPGAALPDPSRAPRAGPGTTTRAAARSRTVRARPGTLSFFR